MSRKITKLAKRLFLGRKEYSGTVTDVGYADGVECGGKFTLYRIKTRTKSRQVIRASVMGNDGYDNSLEVGDEVEVTLGKPEEGLYIKENIKKVHRNGSISMHEKQFAWPPIRNYKLLERRVNEPAFIQNSTLN